MASTRAPDRRPRRLTLATFAVVALVAADCRSVDPYLERCAALAPDRYVIVLPETRRGSPVVEQFADGKRNDGFAIEFVAFDPAAAPRRRLAHVARELDARRPQSGELAYVLFLAGADELPMGPWRIAGLEEPVESDLPLLLGELDPDVPLEEATWSRAMRAAFPWVPGRIPFTDEAALRAALGLRPAVAPSRTALLGSERFAVWGDTALVMAWARSELTTRGWSAVTFAEDWPADVALGEADDDTLRERFSAAGLQVADGGPVPHADLLFVTCWAATGPDVVYVNSHGSSLFGTVTVGDYLFSESKLDRLAAAAAAGDAAVATPGRPAIVVIAACKAGGPASALTSRLFRDGWASVLIASTAPTHPTPLWAAVRAEIDIAAALASGLPVGLRMRAVRESYFDDARCTWSYHLLDSTAPEVAHNLLALTLYGDPSAHDSRP